MYMFASSVRINLNTWLLPFLLFELFAANNIKPRIEVQIFCLVGEDCNHYTDTHVPFIED